MISCRTTKNSLRRKAESVVVHPVRFNNSWLYLELGKIKEHCRSGIYAHYSTASWRWADLDLVYQDPKVQQL